MSDESRLQVAPGTPLSLLKERSSLIARGLRDSTALVLVEPLSETQRLAEHGDADAQYRLACEYCGDFDHLDDEDYANAARWFRRAAKQGHVAAQFELATLYYEAASWESFTGWAHDLCKAIAAAMWVSDLAVLDNYAEAAQWFRSAAAQGHAKAQFNLGYLFQTGRGLRQDRAKAVRWYRRAAKQGHSVASANLGAIYYERAQEFGQFYGGAVKWFRRAAELGLAQGQFSLGWAFWSGRGLPQDYAEAVEWYRKAAEQGHASAQHNLGVAYYFGQGVAQNHREAAEWFRKAAHQGNATAEFALGHLYASGHGTSQDYVQAHMWINLAASASTGDDQRRFLSELDAVAATMAPHQIAEAQRLAREWKPKMPK